MSKGILIVLSGFSGAGKGTLVKELMKTYDNYALSISMTTRKPREGEVHGREYFFTERESFEEKIAQNGLIEYAEYCGNYYGTPRDYVEEMLAAGRDVLLEIEIQGMHKVKKMFPDMLTLFVTPPSIAELEKRLRGRGTETEEVIRKRLARAAEEAKGMEDYEYLVVNDDLQECVEEIHSIVKAAKRASRRNTEFINNIRGELNVLTEGE
ncbi:MAG: guanylate kinase [Lachnospiraceae bacterium]|jgi:guanylate kinase|nr:guanylate kinase [Lachnospiraceae bacterium]MCI5881822.1 guanylate kinase [Clostridium sp.]CDA67903.1 guanylate kinase [Clostridium sp. CAG:510]MDD6179878.1 guanylate kinase [Clostridium sp.]MDY4820148.1 guanylate kinase [Lachnospiraceae bacterium]